MVNEVKTIRMGPSFLEEYNNFVSGRETVDVEWLSSGLIRFQDIYNFDTGSWVTMTPQKVFEAYVVHPNATCRFSLTNGKKWYSVGRLKNIRYRVEVMNSEQQMQSKAVQ